MRHYIWVGEFYPDWFREPMSPLERTWRGPFLFRAAQQVFGEKLSLKIPDNFYLIRDGYVYIRHDWMRLLIQATIPFAAIKFTRGMSFEKKNFEERLLPKYRSLRAIWRSAQWQQLSKEELWRDLNALMETDTRYAIRIAYVGIYGFTFEFLLQWFYHHWVRDDSNGYQELLTGFANRSYELNQVLFEISQQYLDNDTAAFREQFDAVIREYGTKKSDWELSLPVLGEFPDSLRHLIETYRAYPEFDPRRRLQNTQEKRRQKKEFAFSHLRYGWVTAPLLRWILRWAWEYVPLRETRQHFIGGGTYFLRQRLEVLGSRLGLTSGMVYYLEKEEISNAVSGRMDKQHLTRLTQERFAQRELQKSQGPTMGGIIA
jgi:hypothetical protein